MTRVKTPIISLGAHGTLADSVTFQRRSGTNFAREKPIPTDRKTLAQMYQRWDYQDYAAQWHELTNAEKLIYRIAGSKLRLPAFSYFMSIKLATLPDIAGRWRLDEPGGTTAFDTSRNSNDGTFYGTNTATGRIAASRYFDNLDDYIKINHHSSLDLTTELSFEAFVYPFSLPGVWSGSIITKNLAYRSLLITRSGKLYSILQQAVGAKHYDSLQALDLNQWQHVAITFDQPNNQLIFYWRGDAVKTLAVFNSPVVTSTWPVYLGAFAAVYENWDGLIDHAVLYNRILTPSDVKRHSERRYPL